MAATMKVQLLSFPGCPNADAASAALRRALAASRVEAPIEEIDTTASSTPANLRAWGSPTILVGGKDIAGDEGPSGTSCRLYRDADGRLQGTPPDVLIHAALAKEARVKKGGES